MPEIILLLGVAILTGYVAGEMCEKINLPKVVGWILGGVALGASGFGLFELELLDLLNPISFIVLALIGFDIGGELSYGMLRRLGKSIATIAVFEALGAFVMVTTAVTLVTKELWMGLIFGGLSVATAPAATVEVLREYHSSGPLTSTTFAIVGVDDALAIIMYAFGAGLAKMLFIGKAISLLGIVEGPLIEIFGALLLGGVIGVVFAYTTRFTHTPRELLLLSFGTILALAGIARFLRFSYILASMALGIMAVNLPFSNKRCFDVVNEAKPPLFVLFFVFVGARLQVGLLTKIGAIGVLYILFRTLGKGAGSWTGARISGNLGFLDAKARATIEKYFWLCLFSQAGVAIGLALEAMHTFAEYGAAGREFGAMVITIITGTALIFELIGPPSVRLAIFKAGEVRRSETAK
ncbi:MAG: cation:proton antiporter [Candidatus Hydrothermarchaeaceae archaeon]